MGGGRSGDGGVGAGVEVSRVAPEVPSHHLKVTPRPCLSFPLALQGPLRADVLELDLFWGVLGLELLRWAGGPVGWARVWLGWWSSGTGAAQAGGLQINVQLGSIRPTSAGPVSIQTGLVSIWTSVHPEWDPRLWCPFGPGSNLSSPHPSQAPQPGSHLTAERTRPMISHKMTPNPLQPTPPGHPP